MSKRIRDHLDTEREAHRLSESERETARKAAASYTAARKLHPGPVRPGMAGQATEEAKSRNRRRVEIETENQMDLRSKISDGPTGMSKKVRRHPIKDY